MPAWIVYAISFLVPLAILALVLGGVFFLVRYINKKRKRKEFRIFFGVFPNDKNVSSIIADKLKQAQFDVLDAFRRAEPGDKVFFLDFLFELEGQHKLVEVALAKLEQLQGLALYFGFDKIVAEVQGTPLQKQNN